MCVICSGHSKDKLLCKHCGQRTCVKCIETYKLLLIPELFACVYCSLMSINLTKRVVKVLGVHQH